MGKHESIADKGETVPSGAVGIETPPPSGDVGPASDTPKMALASIEAPKIDVAKIDTPKIDIPTIETPSIESPSIAFTGLEPPNLEPPKLDTPRMDDIPVAAADFAPPPDGRAEEPPVPPTPYDSAASRSHRFPLLAASLVLAASLGAMVGSLVSTSLIRSTPAAPVVAAKSGIEEMQALKEQVVQVRVDLAALKTSIDAGQRSANAQFTRIGERVDRIDRTQAEPVAKLTKAIEAFERRADLHAKETTGSITPPQPIGAPAKQSGGVEGWVVRDVQRGTALIEGRIGMIEVDPGDVVPGLGRVEAIRKQDGRWVVVTSKGLILPPRAERPFDRLLLSLGGVNGRRLIDLDWRMSFSENRFPLFRDMRRCRACDPAPVARPSNPCHILR